ncbi:MAG: putative rRNA methylase, SpoU family [Chlamydiales bacterium]|nr:putative rRNA methylase, SpoU family [Chlamydiales bacterium]
MIPHITSLQHNLVKHSVKLRENRAYRHEQRTLILYGNKLIKEVCKVCPAKRIWVSNQAQVDYYIRLAQEIILTSEEVIKKMAGVISAKEVAAEVPLPQLTLPNELKYLLVLDGLSDPGNIGTLIRTALALGWDAIYLIGNSVDPFNDKAIRAAKGATFHIPLLSGSHKELLQLVENHQLTLLAADSNGTEPFSLKKGLTKIALVLGNESHGPSPAIKDHSQVITIPMVDKVDSLNVAIAGSILLYNLRHFV